MISWHFPGTSTWNTHLFTEGKKMRLMFNILSKKCGFPIILGIFGKKTTFFSHWLQSHAKVWSIMVKQYHNQKCSTKFCQFVKVCTLYTGNSYQPLFTLLATKIYFSMIQFFRRHKFIHIYFFLLRTIISNLFQNIKNINEPKCYFIYLCRISRKFLHVGK